MQIEWSRCHIARRHEPNLREIIPHICFLVSILDHGRKVVGLELFARRIGGLFLTHSGIDGLVQFLLFLLARVVQVALGHLLQTLDLQDLTFLSRDGRLCLIWVVCGS